MVLLRHRESVWNKENRFTGWTDVDLSENGVDEARSAGRLLSESGFVFDLAFTSMLKKSHSNVMDRIGRDGFDVASHQDVMEVV